MVPEVSLPTVLQRQCPQGQGIRLQEVREFPTSGHSADISGALRDAEAVPEGHQDSVFQPACDDSLCYGPGPTASNSSDKQTQIPAIRSLHSYNGSQKTNTTRESIRQLSVQERKRRMRWLKMCPQSSCPPGGREHNLIWK